MAYNIVCVSLTILEVYLIEKKKPLREIIYNKVVEDIVHGRINAGEKLLESELAENFHVSRPPIRNVLLQLKKTVFDNYKT